MNTDVFLTWIASDNGLVVHLGILALLLLGGLGFPIPEDVPILLAGVAASKEIVHLKLVWLTCYGGVLLADQIIYWIGYFFGRRLLDAGTRSPFFPSFTEEKVDEVREGLRKKRLAIIFIGRHLFPVRSVTFLTAGALRIPYLEFLLADAFAALISVTIVLALGYYLGATITPEVISHVLQQAHIYLAALVVLTAAWYYFKLKRRSAPKVEEESSVNHATPQDTEKKSAGR